MSDETLYYVTLFSFVLLASFLAIGVAILTSKFVEK